MKNLWKLFTLTAAIAGAAVIMSGCQKDVSPEVELKTTNDIIKGQYIVVFHESGQTKSDRMMPYEEGLQRAYVNSSKVLRENNVPEEKIGHVYNYVLEGFSATLTDEEFIRLRNDTRVKYIEPDATFTIFNTQSNATWGIDRVDQRDLPLNQTYTWDATGLGVTAYIIDTGIFYDHVEFEGRASFGYDAFGQDGTDGNGHGTHVAGTVGGKDYGVAKKVNLVAVRVLDNSGSGTTTGVIAGMDWVAANHIKPAVANMSLGGGASTATDDAVARMFEAGVPVIVAAGNGNRAGREQDACGYSPAGAPKAYTVGATTSTDSKASYSNYGDCVDLFAPGSSITSAWYTSTTATNTISGTSMASPHVAGGAALFLSVNTTASPQQVYDFLYTNSTKGIVANSKTVKNHLLYTLSGDTGGGGGDENQAPVADFTYTTIELSASFDASGSYDPDGTIAAYAWDFGDGSSATGITTSRTYSAAGTYTVALTVTDDGGLTSSVSQNVTVSSTPTTGDFVLAVVGYKVKGAQHADLTWSGATTSLIDVYRDDVKVATVDNNGSWTHSTTIKGGGTHTYQLFEVDGTQSSNAVTVVF